MTGAEIRAEILSAGVKIWQVADKFGITDAGFSRKLRHNFSDEDTQKVLSIIENLKNE